MRRVVFVRPAFDDRSLPDNLRPFPVIGQILADAGPAGAAEFQERSIFQQVAAASPAGGRALLDQFQAPDAARRAMRLVEIPRNRAFADDAELAELDGRGIRSLVVAAPRDPVHPFPIAERWAGGLHTMLELLPARDDGQAEQTRGAARTRLALAAAGLSALRQDGRRRGPCPSPAVTVPRSAVTVPRPPLCDDAHALVDGAGGAGSSGSCGHGVRLRAMMPAPTSRMNAAIAMMYTATPP